MQTLLWFRGKDLRLHDHPALADSLVRGTVLAVFVLDPFFFSREKACEFPHRIQFLLESLVELQRAIEARGSRLFVVPGKSMDAIPQLAEAWGVERVAALRWTEPFARKRDRLVAERLSVPFDLYEGETLHRPGTLRTGAGAPYRVFTPFSRAFWSQAKIGEPLSRPERLPPPPADVTTRTTAVPDMEDLGLKRNAKIQTGGEVAARERLERFLEEAAAHYDQTRNRMDLAGTSRLSADIKFGTLSVRTVWTEVHRRFGDTSAGRSYLNELIWREFTHSTLWDRPEALKEPLRPEFVDFPWRFDERLWTAWESGLTGYPVVDAASRQLRAEGFVHNRARMVHAAFLTKHLLIDYRFGEAHYMKYLTDGDWAQNNAGWQWSAGCGYDAQPYFRVFNPTTQGKKFDPSGDYVRRWIPELRELPPEYCHEPWLAPPVIAGSAGVRIGADYPAPVVDHKEARERFLTLAKSHLQRANYS